MKVTKLLSAAFAAASSAFLLTVSAAAYNVSVYDNAELFSDDEYSEIVSKAEDVSENGSWNILIMTVSGDPGQSVMSYADDNYESENGVNASGVCIVLNPSNPDENEADVYLGTYGSAITLITDGRVNKFLDDVFPYYDDYQDANAVLTGLDTLNGFINEGVYDDAAVVEGSYDDNYDYDSEEQSGGFNISAAMILSALVFAAAVSGITVGCIAGSYKFHAKQTANAYLDRGNLNMYRQKDVFLRETHTRTKIDSGSSGGGSSRSHTSSTHRTSSGGRAGGGGRSSSRR